MEDVGLEAAIEPPPELRGQPGIPEAVESGGSPRGSRGRVFVGSFVRERRSTLTLEIRTAEAHENREPPRAGVLFLSVSGDRVRLKRREEARALIASAECPMPQLGLLLEDSPVPERRRQAHQPLSAAARAMFGGEPTARQIEALRVALNTPDIALIQGPPGTGKTRTIAALQARLAELSEDGELSAQTLLTSYQHDAVENAADCTLVFGLPAIKVGRKRGDSENRDGFERWRRERIDAIRADLASQPERPVSGALRTVRALAAAYLASPTDAAGSARLLDTLADLSGRFLSPGLEGKLRALRQDLGRSPRGEDDGDLDARAHALKAVRALRVEPIGFGDDGPRSAERALYRLEIIGSVDEDTRGLLRLAADWAHEETPPFLRELETLQGRLLDELTIPVMTGAPGVSDEIEQLLPRIVDELFSRARESSGGEDAVLGGYLDDLENDAEGVRSAVRSYTVVLAATCQQAVSFEMSTLKGEDSVFANVIVDEAARANPLDLFIPMSRAERRIILVGDHRQLPHILEPDVEAQLDEPVGEATARALRRSLFERLFETMRAREARDGIKRTVTLDIQYRMHPVLGAFVSDTFYTRHGEAFSSGHGTNELLHRLPGYGEAVAAWRDMPLSAGPERSGRSKRRPAEAAWIAGEIERLATHRPDLSFGVISFYAAQVDEVLKAMEPRGMAERSDDGSRRVADGWRETRGENGQLKERVRVGTVDGFQGKELDVIFLSMTRSNDLPVSDERSLRRKVGHLLLENRLCVAMSRQRRLLVVVGDAAMLRGDVAASALRGLVAFRSLCEGKHGLTLPA
jgi:hypothetical protein